MASKRLHSFSILGNYITNATFWWSTYFFYREHHFDILFSNINKVINNNQGPPVAMEKENENIWNFVTLDFWSNFSVVMQRHATCCIRSCTKTASIGWPSDGGYCNHIQMVATSQRYGHLEQMRSFM